MTTRYATFEIRVYPLVKKFLAYHYATAPFEVSNIRNPYSSYLYACLDRFDHRDTKLPRKYEQLTDTLTLGVANWRSRAFGAGLISPTKVSAFNDFVRQLFFEKLTAEVALHTAFGAGLKVATQRFLDRYGISEDELPIDTALRYYARHRQRMLAAGQPVAPAVPLEYCPETPASACVILPHEGVGAQWQMESGGRQVA